MRRSVASLLLVLLLVGFALPLLQAQSSVPACCRRDGKHHCTAPATADGFRALAPCCQYRLFRALKNNAVTALGTSARNSFAPAISQNAVPEQSKKVLQFFAPNNPQRGPPLA